MDAGHGNSHSAGHAPGIIPRIWGQKWSFFALFIIIFGLTVYVCAVTGFIPNSALPDGSAGTADVTSSNSGPVTLETSSLITGPAAAFSTASQQSGEVPLRITIPALNKTVTVSNPNTTNVDTLDNYLLNGAVRYPTSAKLGVQGNVIVFGHSSYLPIVHNQAFKTFDGIQNLKQGDQIVVYSNDRQYVYAVQTVEQKNANNDAIPLTATGYTLTLATCDSFATKSDRFVVTATLVGSYPLTSQTQPKG